MTFDRTVRFAGSLLALMLVFVLWAPGSGAASGAGTAWLQPDTQAAPVGDLSGASPCQAAYGTGICCHRSSSVQTAATGTATQAEKQPLAALPAVGAVAPLSPAAPLPIVGSAFAGPPLFLLFPRLRI